MASQSYQWLPRYLAVLEKVCKNKDILELSRDSPEWTNALNDCISLAKKVARESKTAWVLEQDDWGRFMDVICSESKAPEILPETVSILNITLQSETVLCSVSNSAEFDECLTALAQLADSIENDHRSGIYLGEQLWKELRTVVKLTNSASEVLDSTPIRNLDITTYKEKLLNMPLEEKRKLYFCNSNFTTLSNIPTWQESAPRNDPAAEEDPLYPVRSAMNEKVSLFVGDITRLEVDAIVNSADTDVHFGGGVDGAIHEAAGPSLAKECQDLDSIETGTAKITGGYLLPAKYVIHTVGPVGKCAEELQSSYKHCLKILLQNKLRTVAFPCISTGGNGYPKQQAAVIALKTVREFLQVEQNLPRIDRIIFCVHKSVDASIYKDFLTVYFPV